MVALRKDVKVGLTIGAIVVSVFGVYAGLSALAGEKPAADNGTASLHVGPLGNTGNASAGSGTSVAARSGSGSSATARPDASRIAGGASTPPALANPDTTIASGNVARTGTSEDPWSAAFNSGHVQPAVTVTPEPGKPAGTPGSVTSSRSDVIKSLNTAPTGGTAAPGADPTKTTASTAEPSGAITSGGTSSTLTRTAAIGTGSAVATDPNLKTHVVEPGETFSSISAEYYGDSKYFQQIVNANPQVNPNKLKPGTQITIPVLAKKEEKSDTTDVPSTSAATATIDRTRQYVVKPGDSLHKIASDLYGDSQYFQKLYDANRTLIGDSPARLKVGMILTLPEAPKKP